MNTKEYFKPLLFMSILFIINGCKASNNDTKPFTKVINVTSEVFIDAEKLADPRHIVITENYIILGNKNHSPLIEIYDISSKAMLDTLLAIGNGPNEVLIIGNIQYLHKQNKLVVADLFKRKLLGYNLKNVTGDGVIKPEMIYEREEKSTLMFDKLYAGDNCMIAESRDARGRILLLDTVGKEIGYYLSYPDKEKIDIKLDDINHANLYASAMTVNPLLNKVALATYSAGLIDIYSLDKTNGAEFIWNYSEFYPQGLTMISMGNTNVLAHTPKSRNGFTSISSSNNYVYALYSGKLSEDSSYSYGNEVYVVSWDGKTTYKTVLDRQINRLAVDSKDEYIYGITSEMDIIRVKINK